MGLSFNLEQMQVTDGTSTALHAPSLPECSQPTPHVATAHPKTRPRGSHYLVLFIKKLGEKKEMGSLSVTITHFLLLLLQLHRELRRPERPLTSHRAVPEQKVVQAFHSHRPLRAQGWVQ